MEPIFYSSSLQNNLSEINRILFNSDTVIFKKYFCEALYAIADNIARFKKKFLEADLKLLIEVMLESLNYVALQKEKKQDFKNFGDYFADNIHKITTELSSPLGKKFREVKTIFQLRTHNLETHSNLLILIHDNLDNEEVVKNIQFLIRNAGVTFRDMVYFVARNNFPSKGLYFNEGIVKILSKLGTVPCNQCQCMGCIRQRFTWNRKQVSI